MPIGLVGRKVGMTRIFTDDGATLPVTVLDVSDNRVTQIKTAESNAEGFFYQECLRKKNSVVSSWFLISLC